MSVNMCCRAPREYAVFGSMFFRVGFNLLSHFPDAYGRGTDTQSEVREHVHVGFVSRHEPCRRWDGPWPCIVFDAFICELVGEV